MEVSDRDIASLWDMVKSIEHVQEFTAMLTEAAYLESLLVQRAVERELEILGEAARRVSNEFQTAHPEVDWRNTIGLRNVIAHRYEQVDQEIIWRIVISVLPDLRMQIETLLEPD
jgi:uncharacterized protein with HEPN domain